MTPVSKAARCAERRIGSVAAMLIEPVTPTIGARIHDIDLANLDDKALDELKQKGLLVQ